MSFDTLKYRLGHDQDRLQARAKSLGLVKTTHRKPDMRNDPSRLEVLRQLMVLDSARETVYDDFARLVATTLDVPMAMVNMLDADRDCFKACIGVPLGESPASTSFCGKFFDTDVELIVAEDTLVDKNFSTHPFVLGAPFIRFYAGARLTVQGQLVGTLCAYDTKPKTVSVEQFQNLRTLAQAVVESLNARRALPPAPNA